MALALIMFLSATIAWSTEGHDVPKKSMVGSNWQPKSSAHNTSRALQSCSTGYYACSAALGGGCCPSGYTCTTTSCIGSGSGSGSGSSSGSSTGSGSGSCDAGWYACSAALGGDCCPSGTTCTTTSCISAGSGSSTGSCGSCRAGYLNCRNYPSCDCMKNKPCPSSSSSSSQLSTGAIVGIAIALVASCALSCLWRNRAKLCKKEDPDTPAPSETETSKPAAGSAPALTVRGGAAV